MIFCDTRRSVPYPVIPREETHSQTPHREGVLRTLSLNGMFSPNPFPQLREPVEEEATRVDEPEDGDVSS